MVIRVVVAVAKFLYGYVVGDSLPLAIVMGLSLVTTGLLVRASINAWWLVPAVGVAATGVLLALRARPKPVSAG